MRRIDFEGSFNFRDLGGWQTEDGRSVRWGRLFRADSVHLLTEADAERARAELGLLTLLDLRSDVEVQFMGAGLLADAGLSRHHLPLTSRAGAALDSAQANATAAADRSPDTLAAQYLQTLEVSSHLIVDAVRALADGEALPAVFFCSAGKDRTGVLSATILGALGVRTQDIVEDYVLTKERIVPIIERFGRIEGSPDMYRDLPPTHFAPYPETMERVVAGVHEAYGSFSAYLIAKGLPEASLESLSSALLEPTTRA